MSAPIAISEDDDLESVIFSLEQEMLEAAERLEFERAALLRDQIAKLRREHDDAAKEPKKVRY